MTMKNLVDKLEVTLRKLDPVDLHFLYMRLVFKGGYIEQSLTEVADNIKMSQIMWLAENRDFADIEAVIREILDSREYAILPQTATEWIDPKNKRLCVFLWLSLLRKFPPEEFSWYDRWGRQLSHYQMHLMPMKPSSAESCLKFFLDFFYIFTQPVSFKLAVLNELRYEWEQTAQFKHKMLKALGEDNDLVTRWFWEYSTRLPSRSMNFVLDFETFKDKLSLVQVVCDSLTIPVADKILALNKAYSAFHAKKFKEKPKNLKGANFWLGPEQIRMLNEIACKKKISEKDALRSLVHDAYLKLNK